MLNFATLRLFVAIIVVLQITQQETLAGRCGQNDVGARESATNFLKFIDGRKTKLSLDAGIPLDGGGFERLQ